MAPWAPARKCYLLFTFSKPHLQEMIFTEDWLKVDPFLQIKKKAHMPTRAKQATEMSEVGQVGTGTSPSPCPTGKEQPIFASENEGPVFLDLPIF